MHTMLTTFQGAKDAPAPRPNKRPRLGLSPLEEVQVQKSSQKGKSKDVPSAEFAKDSQYQEFAQVMQSRKAGPSWANDERPQATASTSTPPVPQSKKKQAEVVEPDEEPLASDLSDLDWLKRHQKGNAPISESKELTVLDQSDEEMLADESSDKDVSVTV